MQLPALDGATPNWNIYFRIETCTPAAEGG